MKIVTLPSAVRKEVTPMKSMKLLFLLVAALLLSACGPKLDGTYADEEGTMTLTFISATQYGERVSYSDNGMETTAYYEVEGNKIIITKPDSAWVLTLQDDGSLQDKSGLKYTKRKK